MDKEIMKDIQARLTDAYYNIDYVSIALPVGDDNKGRVNKTQNNLYQAWNALREVLREYRELFEEA